MITAIALDDEPPALKVVESFCERTAMVNLAKTFTNPGEALKYLGRFPADLVFLDIRMPSVSGLQFQKQMPPDIMVIFTTAYSEYAVEGFNVNAVDYLLKPFTFERFMQAVSEANDFYSYLHHHDTAQQQYFFVRADYSLVKITHEEILYIEGLDDYLRIFLQGKKPVIARMTMKSILEKLPAKDFARIHRSYIVPITRIEKVRNKTVYFCGKEIRIGSSFETSFADYHLG